MLLHRVISRKVIMKSLVYLTRKWSEVASLGSLCGSDVDCQHVVVDVPSFKCTSHQAIFCFQGAAESDWGRGIKSAQLPVIACCISPLPCSSVEILSKAAEGSHFPDNWSKMICTLSETEVKAKLIHYGMFTTPSFTASIGIFVFTDLARASSLLTIWRTKFHQKYEICFTFNVWYIFQLCRNSLWFLSLCSPTVLKTNW